MPKSRLFWTTLLCSQLAFAAHAQSNAPKNQTDDVPVIIGTPTSPSAKVIAIPADTSWTGSISFQRTNQLQAGSGNAMSFLHEAAANNGLDTTASQPWHIVIAYDQFDEDGDNTHSGVLEETWAGPKKYKINYKGDALNQTDYATELGLFRLGDQRWPNRAEMQVLSSVITPFFAAANLQNVKASNIERTFGSYSLRCILFERSGGIIVPMQFCFNGNGSELRYTRGEGWFQTTYNDIAQIAKRNVARQVTITDGGHKYLNIRVTSIESLSAVDENAFAPPAEAINLSGKRVSGINLQPIQTSFPQWPSSLRQQHFSITLQIVVGKDGHVLEAHALSGPSDGYKAAETAARQWRFQPHLILEEPVESEQKIVLSNN